MSFVDQEEGDRDRDEEKKQKDGHRKRKRHSDENDKADKKTTINVAAFIRERKRLGIHMADYTSEIAEARTAQLLATGMTHNLGIRL